MATLNMDWFKDLIRTSVVLIEARSGPRKGLMSSCSGPIDRLGVRNPSCAIP